MGGGSGVAFNNAAAGVVEARVLTGRGPTAIAIDTANALAYVAHFTDSYVGIIDLDRRHATYGTIVRALGRPTAHTLWTELWTTWGPGGVSLCAVGK